MSDGLGEDNTRSLSEAGDPLRGPSRGFQGVPVYISALIYRNFHNYRLKRIFMFKS